ncbi:MAG: hypothetical protein R3C61_01750 [Bacteroidia bacterium]
MKLSELLPDLQHRIASGEQETVVKWLLEISRLPAFETWKNSIIQLSAQWGEHQREKKQDTVSADVLRQRRSQIRQSLLELADEMEDLVPDVEVPLLPEVETGPEETETKIPLRTSGIREGKLRGHIMALLIAIKVILILFLWFLKTVDAISISEFITTATMMVPLFAAWIGVMFNDWLKTRNQAEDRSPYVSRRFQMTVYAMLLGYGLIFFLILSLRGPATVNHEQMNLLLVILESGLGIYIGKLVTAMYNG